MKCQSETFNLLQIKINLIVHVCFVLFIFFLYVCVCECLLRNNNHKTKHKNNTNSGSAQEPGGSNLPYYCTPPVCVPHVLGLLAVWRLQTKKQKSLVIGLGLPNQRKKERIVVGTGFAAGFVYFVFCLKVCSWYKTDSETGNLAGVRYVSILSIPGI